VLLLGKKIEVQLKGKKWSLVQAAFTDFGSVVQLAQFCSAQSEHCLMLKNHSGQCSLLYYPGPSYSLDHACHCDSLATAALHCTAAACISAGKWPTNLPLRGYVTSNCCCCKIFSLAFASRFPL
jgi:hypothetical protein